MLAEKAALLGRTEDDDEEVRPSISTHANTTTSTDQTSVPLTTPGATITSDPLASPPPPSNAGSDGRGGQPMSEKARGKMRATSISSVTTTQIVDDSATDEEIMRLADGGVGPNGYVPTQEWVSSWQKG
jgi:hypothetical protein